MNEHLSQTILNALADGELTAEQLASAQEHLSECPECTSKALYQSMLKTATAKAGRRYSLPSELQQRLARIASHQPPATGAASVRPVKGPVRVFNYMGWAAAAVLLLVFGGVVTLQRGTQRTALFTEVCDQHIAMLAGNLPPQVLSSDKHTVKPWFQGKLPFSFNLPENLPGDTKLDGANLTYMRNQPAAQLLYSIGRHRVSVFIRERTGAVPSGDAQGEHAGFHVAGFNDGDLEVVAVSDVDPARLSGLVRMIEEAQKGISR
jgi:anti-sigma factor RsiW